MNTKSLKQSVQDAKNKLLQQNGIKRLGGETSTIKTLDILKMINGVNKLNDKQESLKHAKFSNLAVQFNNNDPLNREEAAFDAVHSMLLEEGVEFDPAQSAYIDEKGLILDLDVNKIVQEYLECMDRTMME